ncbi:MAG: phosphoribosylanthranilate isomerase [Chromatiales bacterium]|jgi:phosphoribosylanthranilate isomerase|nr:phosphoribosylanthranilate isomerase [Chromatiales bacterium]
MRTRIKICGITRPRDGLAAAQQGADAIGLVFHPLSSRRVDVARAAEIVDALPPFCAVVALFVDPAPEIVHDVLAAVPIDLLQFHGEESAEFCRDFGVPYMKAVHMRPGVDLMAQAARYSDAAALLLDTWHEKLAGGTGESFAWQRLPAGLTVPVMLAGGLHAGNVAEAIRIVRPYGVDVSSGVEAAPGIKDTVSIGAFMRAVMTRDGEANDG